MANMARDGVIFQRFLTGLITAGGGVALYFGYQKWRSRLPPAVSASESADTASQPASQKSPETKDKEDSKKDEDVGKIDPTPVLQPESLSSASSSTNNGPESLSVSTTFEKVSLSAFQERPPESEDPATLSPSDEFEKVSLPPSNSENTDVSSTGTTQSGSIHDEATHTTPEEAHIPKPNITPQAPSAPKEEIIKPETATDVNVSSSILLQAPEVTTEASLKLSSDPEPASPKPRDVAKETTATSKSPHGDDESANDDDGGGDEDANEDEDADEDDEEEATTSDASADSQVKDD